MIESIAWVLIPIAFVCIVLVGLVLLFARERALTVLKNLYLYGVLVTMFLISVVTVIVLFNTLLNTVVFPTQTDYSYSRPLDYIYDVEYDPGVEDFLKEKQAVIDKRVDAISFTQNWRDQLAWAIPLLLVCLPLFIIYRRKIIKPIATTDAVDTNSASIRFSYLFLTAYLSLIAFAIGGVGVLNVALEQYILPPHYNTYDLRYVLRDEIGNKYSTLTMPVAVERAEKAMNTLEERIKKAQAEKTELNERNRALSLGFSFLIIGGAIYLWHRKDVLKLINS